MPTNGIPENVRAALERRDPETAGNGSPANGLAHAHVLPSPRPLSPSEANSALDRAQQTDFQDIVIRTLFGIHSELLMMNYLEVGSRIRKLPRGLSSFERKRFIVQQAAKDVLLDEDRAHLKERMSRFQNVFGSRSGLPPLATPEPPLDSSPEVSREVSEETPAEEKPVGLRLAFLTVILLLAMSVASFYALIQTH